MSKPSFSRKQYYAKLQERLEQAERGHRMVVQEEEMNARRAMRFDYDNDSKLLMIRLLEETETSERMKKLLQAQSGIALQPLHDKWTRDQLTAVTPSAEQLQRSELQTDEEETRRAMILRESYQLATSNIKSLQVEEERWRWQLRREESDAWTKIWGGIIAPKLLFYLTDVRGTHSEPNYRKLWILQERNQRQALAVTFCTLQLRWKEEWRRFTIRVAQKTFVDYFTATMKTSRQEAIEREEYRLLFEPVQDDIKEQMALREQREHRKQNKLAVLKKLRDVEVHRMKARDEERADYVAFWKADELLKIREAQEAILQEVAAADMEAGGPVEYRHQLEAGAADDATSAYAATWERLSKVFEEDFQYLDRHQDTIPFNDILQYREKLLEFDNFVSAVEKAVAERPHQPHYTGPEPISKEAVEADISAIAAEIESDDGFGIRLVGHRRASDSEDERSPICTRNTHSVRETETGKDLLMMMMAKASSNPQQAFSSPAPARQKLSTSPRTEKRRVGPHQVDPLEDLLRARDRSQPQLNAQEPRNSWRGRNDFVPAEWLREEAEARADTSRHPAHFSHSPPRVDGELEHQLKEVEATALSRIKVKSAINANEQEQRMQSELERLHSWLYSHTS